MIGAVCRTTRAVSIVRPTSIARTHILGRAFAVAATLVRARGARTVHRGRDKESSER